MNPLARWCHSVTADSRFHAAVLGLIVLNAALMGLETSSEVMAAAGEALVLANSLIQALFVLEISLRIVAYWPSPGRFFREGWNVFDFTVIALSLLPVAGPFATVSRLARLLRVGRLVSVSSDLRLIVQTMLRSIPSMGHVSLLLGLLVYIYAVAGFYLFGETDPAHWGSLSTALLSVFQLLTLEGWVEMQGALLPSLPWAWVYFASFVVIGVFVIINLFIAVVLNNLERVRAQERTAGLPDDALQIRIEELREALARFEAAMQKGRHG